MKRKDIVTGLMKNGLSEKTLVEMSDKQLKMLAERLLSEQNSTATKPVTKVSQMDVATQTDLKNKKLPYQVYEGDVKEELQDPKLGTEPKSTDDKELVIKRLKFKIEHDKDKDKVEDAKKLLAKLTKKKEDKNLKEWVEQAIEKNYHPFTSKNEIMELIQTKLTEQKPQEHPHTAEPDIEVEPGKKTKPGVDPDDPFRDPHPGIDPNPKAKKKHKMSAEDAKNKIIALLKKKL